MAKELDPKDPYTVLLRCHRKQTTNRPVEALHDMQQAIELNDNRMVYRSSHLLDSDLAASSAAWRASITISASSNWLSRRLEIGQHGSHQLLRA